MDFIEQWLGLSPDGGNGLFELMILVAPLVVVAFYPRYRARNRF
jgi:hypothetical protein